MAGGEEQRREERRREQRDERRTKDLQTAQIQSVRAGGDELLLSEPTEIASPLRVGGDSLLEEADETQSLLLVRQRMQLHQAALAHGRIQRARLQRTRPAARA